MTDDATSPTGSADTKEASPSEEGSALPSTGDAGKPASEEAPPPEARPYRPNYVFLAVVSIASLALDLGTKAWAKARLEDAKSFQDRHIEVIPKYLSLIFARNKGGAWGLLQDQPESVRRPFFLGISVLAIVFIVSLYRRLTPQQTALKWGLPLVLGGALGNLVNRIQYNYVVDFIDVYVTRDGAQHHWPTFNVADIAICVGVGLMAVDMFTSRRAPTKVIPSPPPSAPRSDEDKPAEKASEGT